MILWLHWIPLAGAFAILLSPKESEARLKNIALGCCGICFLIVLFLFFFFQVDPSINGGYQYFERFDWFPALGIHYEFGLDGLNLTLCLLHALVSLAGAFVSCSVKNRLKDYLFFYLILVGAIYGVFTALDIFFIYLFYEMTLIPLYPMIGIWGSGSTRPTLKRPCSPSSAENHPEQANIVGASRDTITKEYGAMKLTIFITSGAVLALFGLLILYRESGATSFDLIQLRETFLHAKPLTAEMQKYLAGFLIVGFGVIASLWPLHSWSPIGYAAAPTSVSMLHAGVLKKMGPYLILRIAVVLLPAGVIAWSPLLAILSCIGILYAGYAAIRQQDLKFMIGFSSVSHMGYILLGIAALTPTALSGAVFLMFSHGVMAACTFAIIGFLYEQTHMRGVQDFGGLGKTVPFLSVCFIMAALASLGLPGFSNFVSELLVFIGTWTKYPLLVALAIFGVLITSIYLLRAVQHVCYGPANSKWDQNRLKDAVGFFERFPFILLIGALLIFGFWPHGLLRVIEPAVGALLK